MQRRTINRLIGYGILIFLFAFFMGTYGWKYLQWLILVGAGLTFLGIYFFFKTTDLSIEFAFKAGDDFLTYFWKVLALKIWTFILSLWMMVMIFELLTKGHI